MFLCFLLMAIVFVSGCNTTKNKPFDAKQQKCITILQEGLNSDQFWPSIHAAEALATAGYKDEVKGAFTLKLISEKDDRKRCGLARELIRAGEEQYVSILVEIIQKEDEYSHVHAVESLYKTGLVGDVERLKKFELQNSDIKLKLWASAAMAKNGNEDSLKVLRTLLNDQDPLVRSLAAHVLGQLGDMAEIQRIKENYILLKEPINRFLTFSALVYLNRQEATDNFVSFIEYDNDSIKSLAANVVAQNGLIQYESLMLKNLNSPNLDVRIRSAEAILRF